MYLIGLGKKEIQNIPTGIGMLGFAIPEQRITGYRHPLNARAFVVTHPETDTRMIYCVAELCFMTQAIRHGVLEKLENDFPQFKINEHNLMLAATHTHSGPAGYSHFLLYNMTAPGFVTSVYESIVEAVVEAIVLACEAQEPGEVCLAQEEIPSHHKVAFNRSLKAYNQNPEIDPVPNDARNEAVDRSMTVLRFQAQDGRALGMFSFFAVHCTSYHSDNGLIDSDNKGVAARKFEKQAARELGQDNFVAAFAQTTAGDVSPNYVWDAKRGIMAGEYESDENSAIYNGELQHDFATKLFKKAKNKPLAVKPLKSLIHYEDHGQVDVDPEFCGGRLNQRTTPGDIGLSMIMGTAEGRGPLYHARPAVEAINHLTGVSKKIFNQIQSRTTGDVDKNYEARFTFLDLARGYAGRCFYLFKQGRPILPGFVDPGVARVRHLNKNDAVGDSPWTPQVLPIQLMVLGELALVAIPGEPTTIAGRRLQQSLKPHMDKIGVKQTLIAGFANAYAGYITTHEEYAIQAYEGGSTHFGAWTLAGFQTRYDALAKQLCQEELNHCADTGLSPYVASQEELYFRRYELA